MKKLSNQKKNGKVRKASKKTLKAKAWKAFARFIKARDARNDGTVLCCTCNGVFQWDSPQVHAGHFVGGRTNSVLFEEDIVHGQCCLCNLFRSGEQALYALFMKRKYGYTDAEIETLLNRRHQIVKYMDADYIQMAEDFNNRADALIALKGL